MFDPGLKIGQTLTNKDIINKFKCGNMGGMRRSKRTNTLVLVTDYTKGFYHDKWIDGVLHYTGMGKNGDQKIDWLQNRTLAESKTNGVDIHLFEVLDPGVYTYCGRVRLIDLPYMDRQPDEDGIDRNVWMFPIQPIPNNDVVKPQMYVFSTMDEYKRESRQSNKDIPHNIIGKKVSHNHFGVGKIVGENNASIIVDFGEKGKKTLNYYFCINNGLLTMYE